MSNPNRSTGPQRARQTIILGGTVDRVQARLDHASAVAAAWARRCLQAGPLNVDPLASGVIRRALQVYTEHLQAPGLDPKAEARAVQRCCSVLAPDEATQAAAWARLEAIPQDAPVPPLKDVLRGPRWRAELADFNARAEATAAACMPRRAIKCNTAKGSK